MLFFVVVLSLACVTSGVPAETPKYIFQRQQLEPRGFLPIPPPPVKNATNASDYFALTDDGRLERIQLVFPEGSQKQQQYPAVKNENFLLTPDGRLEKVQEEPVENNEVDQYFQLTEDGRLQRIRQEDVPTDAKEENGEYHVLLPSGSLQRVRFMTSLRGNLLSAKVQYQEVEPLQGPVYKYAAPLVRVI